jgi:hypothetical protein
MKLAARRTRQEFETARHLMRDGDEIPKVVAVSAKTKAGLPELWTDVVAFFAEASASGRLDARRKRQLLDWMWTTVERALIRGVRESAAVKAMLPALEREVTGGAPRRWWRRVASSPLGMGRRGRRPPRARPGRLHPPRTRGNRRGVRGWRRDSATERACLEDRRGRRRARIA